MTASNPFAFTEPEPEDNPFAHPQPTHVECPRCHQIVASGEMRLKLGIVAEDAVFSTEETMQRMHICSGCYDEMKRSERRWERITTILGLVLLGTFVLGCVGLQLFNLIVEFMK